MSERRRKPFNFRHKVNASWSMPEVKNAEPENSHSRGKTFSQLEVRPWDMYQFCIIYCTFAMSGEKPPYACGTFFRVTSDQNSFGQE